MEVYDDDALTIFRDALSNPVTRGKYERRLELFFEFLELEGDTLQSKSDTFVKKAKGNPSWATQSVARYMRHQKERVEKGDLSASTISNYYKPIKLFCEMNDVILNWKKITRGLPKGRQHSDDRIPTLDEIIQLLKYPDRRLKPAILTMLSSGIRLGAWDHLRWGDIIPIDKNGKIVSAKIIVYRGEPEEYFSFITSEAYHSIKEYLDFRKSHGETISAKTWILRDAFDLEKSSRGMASVPQQLQSTGLKRLIERALWGQKLRKPLEDGKKRHEFKADHGFRKYFKTMAEQQMKSLHVELLMGHSIGLGDNYYRITEPELLEEYLKAVPALSVYESPLTISDDTIKNLQQDVSSLQYEMENLKKLIINNTQINANGVDKFLEYSHRFYLIKQHMDNGNIEEARRVFNAQ
ncbi:MAG: hypothetical protein ACYC6W_03135 [Nitrosotalea sp.]